jgi:Flp pilus assembly protein TadG
LTSHRDNNRIATIAPPARRRGRAFISDTRAATAITFALSLPVLAVAAGAAVDYSSAAATRTRMQGIADAAAMASVQEVRLAQTNEGKVVAVATNYVNAAMPGLTTRVAVDFQASTVQVNLTTQYAPLMGTLLFRQGIPLAVNATAKLSGSLPLCMLALDPASSESISLQDSAVMQAPGCLVQANSMNKFALDSHDSAVLKAGMICSSGGALKFVSSNFSPQPTTDCPQLPDPVSSRPAPTVGACNHTNTVIDGLTQTLQPGTYCGGLKVTNAANVHLSAGIYVISGGPLIVDNGATLKGTNVGFYLSGANANLSFDTDSTIHLSAPTSGPLAGLLVYDDPSGAAAPATPLASGLTCNSMAKTAQYTAPPRQHQIYSNNARNLTGTIYMPKGELLVDASKPIAAYSAYTVLVVAQLHLCAGPTLVLNTDYSATDVPVPAGLGPRGGKTYLTN